MSWSAEVEGIDKDILVNKLENVLDKSRSYLDKKSLEIVDQQIELVKDLLSYAKNDTGWKHIIVCAGHYDEHNGVSSYQVRLTKAHTGT